ncbi:zf-HC2 domain-containing protein [Bdellovibrio sp. HCB-162]|uniref:zf-HC2 domain-containing protein n=1 Tax=Bdellovibrio sp. HCB-162 TaxID=3394234 RepID=UPI0039BD3BF0
MAQQENKIPLSKKGKREISPFIGHELLYDYLSGSLDKERRAAVEDHVKFSRDAQLDLTKIQNGQTYAERLADTVVSQPIIAQISAPSSYLSVLMQKSNFDKWPQGLKWGLEALVVVVAIVTLLTVTPWQKVMQLGVGTGSKEVVLAEVSKNTSSETPPVVEEKPEFIDEGVSKETPKEHGKEAAKETAVAKTEAPKPSPTATTAATTASVPKKEEKPAAETAPAAASGGFLYRGEIAVTNIDVIGPKITEKINELGGRKAGSVELGWKKTPGSMYYHFTIPEAKYQDLLTFLGTYGKPKIGKEKHPRVMPDGIVRMIITVDEAKK